jgi:hypothetical protein
MYICIYVYIMPITIISASGDNPLCGKEAFFVRKSGLFHRGTSPFLYWPLCGKSRASCRDTPMYAYTFDIYFKYISYIHRYVCIQIYIVRTLLRKTIFAIWNIHRKICMYTDMYRTDPFPLCAKIFAISFVHR